MVITPHHISNSCWWQDCPMHKSWEYALHNLQKSLAGNMPVILCSCFYRSLSSSYNSKSQLINLWRLDHAQTEGTCVYLLPSNFLNYPSAMPSLLTSPLLNHGQFRNVLANAFSLIAFWYLLPLWYVNTEVSLIWLEGPDSQLPQAKEITATVSNTPLSRKESNKKKPEYSAVCSSTEWGQKISTQDRWIYHLPSLSSLYLHQVHDSAV